MVTRQGVSALSMRTLAAEAGTSTTAVYSLFGGRSELLQALYVQAFSGFGAAQEAVPVTDDPSADLLGLGRAYRCWALDHPHFYAIMFGGALVGIEPDERTLEHCRTTMDPLLSAVGRGRADGRAGPRQHPDDQPGDLGSGARRGVAGTDRRPYAVSASRSGCPLRGRPRLDPAGLESLTTGPPRMPRAVRTPGRLVAAAILGAVRGTCLGHRGCSAVGSALRSHRRGQGFDSPQLHHWFLPLTDGVRIDAPSDAGTVALWTSCPPIPSTPCECRGSPVLWAVIERRFGVEDKGARLCPTGLVANVWGSESAARQGDV